MSHCASTVSGTTTSLAITSTVQTHFKGTRTRCRGLSCPPRVNAKVSLPAGGSHLDGENSGQGSVLLLTSRLAAGALRYLQPVTGCSPEGWYPFLCTVLVFDTPCISTGTDYLNCISIGEYTWNGGKSKNLTPGFSSWNPSAWRASYVKLMLLATIFTVSHLIISYNLSYGIPVDSSRGSYIDYNWRTIFRWS